MKSTMNKQDVLKFKSRLKNINRFELLELREKPPLEKLRQLNIIMGWAKEFGWKKLLREDEDIVRARWNKLKNLPNAR